MEPKKTTDILRDGADTYEQKTTDYGSSWKSIGYILSCMANGQPIVLETPQEIIAFGLFTRRLDKLSREFYGTFFADEMNFEGPVDSAEDESVYASMSAENLRDMQIGETRDEHMAEGYRKRAEEAEPEPVSMVDELEKALATEIETDKIDADSDDYREPGGPVNQYEPDETPFLTFSPSDLRKESDTGHSFS